MRFVTVTPKDLTDKPGKYTPEDGTALNIFRTFGKLKSMTKFCNSAGAGMLYEVCRLTLSVCWPFEQCYQF